MIDFADLLERLLSVDGSGHSAWLIYVGITAALLSVALAFIAWVRRPRYEAVPILTAGELRFYQTLRSVVPEGYILCLKPRIADIVQVKGWRGWRNKYLYQITSKHVDFALLDANTLMPVAAIELDDRSHDRRDRQKRDQLVARVLNKAGIGLVRVKATREYNASHLRRDLVTHLR